MRLVIEHREAYQPCARRTTNRGPEARCNVTFKGESKVTNVHLDTAKVDILGKPAHKVPFERITAIEVKGAELRLTTKDGPLVLELGKKDAEKWALKIRYPKGRLEKLG